MVHPKTSSRWMGYTPLPRVMMRVVDVRMVPGLRIWSNTLLKPLPKLIIAQIAGQQEAQGLEGAIVVLPRKYQGCCNEA
jgi:hypothetical protein